MNNNLSTPQEREHRKYAVANMQQHRIQQERREPPSYQDYLRNQRRLWQAAAADYQELSELAFEPAERQGFQHWANLFHDLATGIVDGVLRQGAAEQNALRSALQPCSGPAITLTPCDPPIDYLAITREVAR